MAQWVRVPSHGELIGIDIAVVKSHGDATEVFGYVAQDRATAVHRRAHRISTAAYTVRWLDLFMAGVIHGEDICVTLSAIQTSRAQIAATSHRR
jgi:hypothetical protein